VHQARAVCGPVRSAGALADGRLYLGRARLDRRLRGSLRERTRSGDHQLSELEGGGSGAAPADAAPELAGHVRPELHGDSSTGARGTDDTNTDAAVNVGGRR
jgi:hypothetical protein